MLHTRRMMMVAAVLAAQIAVTGAVVDRVSALNTVAVTTTSDVTNAADGVLSLREAFSIANTDGDDTQITLAADQLYRLCDQISTATDEDANADGDLDHVAADSLIIAGNGAEIRSQCPGERVLHAVDEAGSIELHDLLIAGGDLGVGGIGSGLFSVGDTTIESTTFTDNTGGVAVEVGPGSPPLNVVVTDSRFSDNRGGIRVNFGSATITDTEFEFNQAAAITANFSSLTATNLLVRENAAGIMGIDGTIAVHDSQVRNNLGIGIRNTGNSATGMPLTVSNTLVERNGNGGVDCQYCTNLTITGSTIVDNLPANGFGGSGVSFLQNLDGPTVTITGSTISGNTATEHGGGLSINAQGVVASVTVTDTTITGNRTGLFGDGGGIRAVSTDLTLVGSQIDGNFAKPDGILVGGSGGGVAMSGGGSLTVTDSTIDGNFADDSGGGVSLLDVPTASFDAVSISDNVADGFGGGGVEAVGTGTAYSFVQSTIDDNSARLAGGGIAVTTSGSGVQVLLDRSTVSNNQTTNSNGGGVFTNTPLSSLTVRNSTVTGNSTPFIGGGLAALSTGTITLDHATVVDNSASETANVRHQAGALTSFGSVIALPQGGGNDCDTFSGAIVSLGYNFSGADTCGFGAGTGDQTAGGNPVLGALAPIASPTAARAPLGGSPLVSAIPPAACTLPIDQAGATRPLGTGCEIGSIELVIGGVVAADDFVSVPARRRVPTVIRPLANDYDPQRRLRSDTLRIVSGPAHGTAVVISKGRILYLADKRFVGTDTFTYKVCTRPPRGKKPECVTAVVTVTVD
jgi:hypothetical protein